MDPLSITTGALALLGVCYKTTIELKRLRNGAVESRGVVTAMLGDILALRGVLQSIEESFDDLDSGPELTGTLANHWWDLRTSLQEGFERVAKLERLLVNVNKDVSFLDGTRRHLRLKEATDEIATYRQEIQAYKDMLQFGHANMERFEQVTIKNNTAQILAKSDDIRHNIDRLQTNLEVRFQTLEALFEKDSERAGLRSVSGLRTAVRSATAVISSASVYGEQAEHELAQPPDIFSVAGDDTAQMVVSDMTINWVRSLDQRLDFPGENVSLSRPVPEPIAGQLSLPVRNGPQRASQSSQDLGLLPDRSAQLQDHGDSHSNLSYRKSDQDLGSNSLSPTTTQGHGRSKSLSKLWNRRRNVSQNNDKEEKRPSPSPTIESTARPLKFIFVGDGACGKTCFLIRGTMGQMPEVYVPTVFETYSSAFNVDGLDVELLMFDTAGQEDYDRLRPLSYPDTDVFCICFAIDSPDSLDNVVEKWIHEIRHFAGENPIIYLLGFKSDLREDARTILDLCRTGQKPVSRTTVG
ncbi:GTP-binding rhoA [Fusarium albosuccineum]|uniref:GTP-binding rhoA n=1 Tax=Fusarium albosuccineum TaxID=1237068 RepID=A0A8H4LAZ6_9HYPO|nr:GTP-binding rhoA [Fusarium albosuccineum]